MVVRVLFSRLHAKIGGECDAEIADPKGNAMYPAMKLERTCQYVQAWAVRANNVPGALEEGAPGHDWHK